MDPVAAGACNQKVTLQKGVEWTLLMVLLMAKYTSVSLLRFSSLL